MAYQSEKITDNGVEIIAFFFQTETDDIRQFTIPNDPANPHYVEMLNIITEHNEYATPLHESVIDQFFAGAGNLKLERRRASGKRTYPARIVTTSEAI